MNNDNIPSRSIRIAFYSFAIVLSQGDCCSNRVCILKRIIRRRGFVCNDSTKHLSNDKKITWYFFLSLHETI